MNFSKKDSFLRLLHRPLSSQLFQHRKQVSYWPAYYKSSVPDQTCYNWKLSTWYIQSNKWHYYNINHLHPFVNNITCLYSYQSSMISMVILCSIVWLVNSIALLSLPLFTIQQLQMNFNSHLVWSKLDYSEKRLYLYECLLNSRF